MIVKNALYITYTHLYNTHTHVYQMCISVINWFIHSYILPIRHKVCN